MKLNPFDSDRPCTRLCRHNKVGPGHLLKFSLNSIPKSAVFRAFLTEFSLNSTSIVDDLSFCRSSRVVRNQQEVGILALREQNPVNQQETVPSRKKLLGTGERECFSAWIIWWYFCRSSPWILNKSESGRDSQKTVKLEAGSTRDSSIKKEASWSRWERVFLFNSISIVDNLMADNLSFCRSSRGSQVGILALREQKLCNWRRNPTERVHPSEVRES